MAECEHVMSEPRESRWRTAYSECVICGWITEEPEAERCPVHGLPDCSPLLNGCSLLTNPGGSRG